MPSRRVITSSFRQAFVNGSVKLKVVTSAGNPTRVEFMDGATSMGVVSTAPFEWNATNLQAGMHGFYAKVYDAEKFSVTNSADVQVGNQIPYEGTAWAIPGTIEAGKYDVFEGGKGQNIAYMDVTSKNTGDFRTGESVDASNSAAEGVYIESIASGEWLEYTVNVSQAGISRFHSGTHSQAVNITVAALMSCSDSSKTATQGTFSLGYVATFETVGTSVTVTFELPDNDKPGLVAYLWKESPFAESQMTNVSGKIF